MPAANGEPPVDAVYHCMAVPVATRLATVGEVALQKVCALAAGAAGVVLTVTVTEVLALSHPVTVWLA